MDEKSDGFVCGFCNSRVKMPTKMKKRKKQSTRRRLVNIIDFRVLDVRYKKNKIYNIGWSSIQIELCMYVLHIFDKNLLKIKIHLNT